MKTLKEVLACLLILLWVLIGYIGVLIGFVTEAIATGYRRGREADRNMINFIK